MNEAEFELEPKNKASLIREERKDIPDCGRRKKQIYGHGLVMFRKQ